MWTGRRAGGERDVAGGWMSRCDVREQRDETFLILLPSISAPPHTPTCRRQDSNTSETADVVEEHAARSSQTDARAFCSFS